MLDSVMFDVLIEPFQYDFMRTAIICSCILSVSCAVLGCLLLTRGLAMLGDGIAHTTLAGVGISLFLGFSLNAAIWFSLPVAILVSCLIVLLGKNTKLASDTLLGVFFAIALAIGVAAIHAAAKRGGFVDIEAVLFGNILGVSFQEMRLMIWFSVLVTLVLALFGPKMAYASFYPELSWLSGVRPVAMEFLLMIVAAVVVVLASRSVGVLLVSAWLVIPASVGRILSNQFGLMTIIALMVSVLGSISGLLLSFYYDIPSGAAMTMAFGLMFGISLAIRGFSTRFHKIKRIEGGPS